MTGNQRNAAVALLLVLIAVGILLLSSRRPVEQVATSQATSVPSSVTQPTPQKVDVQLPPGFDESKEDESDPDGDEKPDDAEFAKYLAERFGPGIANKHTQIKAIEKLIAYLKKFYPDDWQSRLYAMLQQAFPDRADELLAKSKQLGELNAWLEQNRAEVMKMSVRERRDTMWDLRYKIFGKDAYEIWAATLKGEQIFDALDVIAESHEASVDEKLGFYLEVVRTTWGEQADQFIDQRRTELMSHFLSVEAVQDDLHSLPPEPRRAALRTIRRSLGMDDEALQRWDDLDTQRDRSWEMGQAYMREREQIAAAAAGVEQRQQLNELRLKYFGEETEAIQSEEDAGFFRFSRRRTFGKE